MGLKDWDVILQRDRPKNGSAWASTETYYGQRRCEIHLNPDTFFAETPERQRHVIVHELLHCHTDNVNEVVRIFLTEQSGDAASLFEAYFRQQMEYTVDGVATGIASCFPLPDEQGMPGW